MRFLRRARWTNQHVSGVREEDLEDLQRGPGETACAWSRDNGERTGTNLIARAVVACIARRLCKAYCGEGNGEDGPEAHI